MLQLCSVGSGVILPESIDVGESAGNVSSLALCYTNETQMENRGCRPDIPAKRKTAERKKNCIWEKEKDNRERDNIRFRRTMQNKEKRPIRGREHKMCRLLLVQQAIHLFSFLFTSNLDAGHSGSSAIPDITSRIFVCQPNSRQND